MTDPADRLRAALITQNRIEREVGAGRMAAGYLAYDVKHDRDAAIKLLHPDLAAALGGLLVAGLLACGGGGDGATTNTPVVTTVDVSPASATMTAGETLPLTVTVKDQTGAVLSGQSVTWSSSADAIASVSNSGVVTALTAGNVTITASVATKAGSSNISVALPPKLVLDVGRGNTVSVGFTGTTISATSTAGVVYDLTIPAGALDAPTSVTMVPLKAVNRLPISGGLIGGVDFQPSGLTFRSPATLTIHVSPNVPAGQRLIALQYRASGDTLVAEPVGVSATAVTVIVSHFSGQIVGLATPQDLASLLPPPNSAAQDSALVALAGLTLPADEAAILAALRHWQAAIVLRLQLAQTEVAVVDAAAEYDDWLAQLNQYPGADGVQLRTTLAPELASLRAQLMPAYGRAIFRANQSCNALPSFVAARNVLILQAAAERDGVAGPGSPAERPTVLAGMCMQPVVVDLLYPVVPTAGTTAPLDVRVGFQFASPTPTVLFMAENLSLDIHGSTNDRAFATPTDAQGRFSVNLAPTGAGPFRVDGNACPDPASFLFDYPCIAFTLTRTTGTNFGRTITGNVNVVTQADLALLTDVSRITGGLTIGTGITSADLNELQLLTRVDGALTIQNAVSVFHLTGLRNLVNVGALVVRASQLTTLAGLEGLTNIAGDVTLEGLTHVTALTGLDNLATVGGLLTVQSNAQLRDLVGLGTVRSAARGLSLNNMPFFSSLNGLSQLATLGGNIGLQILNVPALSNVDALQSLQSTTLVTMLDLPLLASLQGLRNATISGDVRLARIGLITTLAGLKRLPGGPNQYVNITDNPKLADLAPLTGVTVLAGLNLGRNDLVPDIDVLSSLITVGSQGLFVSGKRLSTLFGLRNLQHSGRISLTLDESPLLTNINFPELLDISGVNGFFATGSGVCTQLRISFPKLTTTTGFFVEVGGGTCDITVSAPLLKTATQGVEFAGGVTSIQLGSPFVTTTFAVVGTNLATSLTLPALTADNLIIDNNTSLLSLGGGGGTIQLLLAIRNNPLLSSQAALTWANSFAHPGQLVIQGNKVP